MNVVVTPTGHLSAPECEKEKGEADRPPDHEAEDDPGDLQGMPRRRVEVGTVGLFDGAAPAIDISGVGHFLLHHGITPL
ncbi:hypothetical protein ABIF33_009249 [Bradyrhizobium elkanii]